ncbi:glycosyltransferase family 2 protein [Williamsia deligens]|uniref:Glycosyltransferase family 2 protein n=1 Tax=Williamsia deligens TaxID=321325 RepID=A0ABW3G3A6_9NOCA|nr:glycosyltransferase family 2 protein [Williamsia deligens]MCP2194088.1 Glycosyl transferase family 2 [Williamsia deligens]
MDDTLTVTIPAHNAEGTVATAIRSTARSLPDDGRIVVLDDASTDGTADVLRAEARRDPRVRVITNSDAPLGVAMAANTLLEQVDTRWVARIDADDVSLPWRLSRQLRALHRGDTDVVFTGAWFYGPSRFAVEPIPLLSADPGSTAHELLLNCPFIQSTLAARREALIEVGGYRAVPAEDWDLFLRLALRGVRMRRQSVPGVLYRRSPGQMSAQEDWKAALRVDSATGAVHRALCAQVLGSELDAYPALCGPGATPAQVDDAREVIRRTAEAAASFPLPERISLRVTAGGLGKRLDGWYGSR